MAANTKTLKQAISMELTRASGPVLAVNQIPDGGKQDRSIGLLDPEADERGAQMKTLVVLDGSGSGDSAKALMASMQPSGV
jgi:hypothetical protein